MTEEMRIWRENEIRKWRFDPINIGNPWPGYVEILKLEYMLVEAQIPFEKRIYHDGWIIIYRDGPSRIGDVIEHFGSYGSEEDLLEAYEFDIDEEDYGDNVVGYLTAEEAFEFFKRAHEKCQNKSEK